MNSDHQNKNMSHQQQKQESRPSKVHSTHSNMETFDQATREQENELSRSSNAETTASAHQQQQNQQKDQQRQLQEATSGVQLDRDVQQSRRVAAESAKVWTHMFCVMSFCACFCRSDTVRNSHTNHQGAFFYFYLLARGRSLGFMERL